MIADAAIVLGLAFALDLALGDPPNAWHPVAWLGRYVSAIVARAPRRPPSLAFVVGVVLVVSTCGLAALAAIGVEVALADAPRAVRLVVSALFLKACFALRGLASAARELVRAFDAGGLDAARSRLSWLCSRDASTLDASGLANGTVESLAENLADSVVAPLFYFALFGLPGAALYRAINTLDAMVGYRGEFEWLGKPAARLDDLANLVPARLTAACLGVVGLVRGAPIASALRVYRRDRMRTESPNAGHPMAMAAGILGVRLDKPGIYVLGEGQRTPTLADVAPAVSLVGAAAVVFVAFAFVALTLVGGSFVRS